MTRLLIYNSSVVSDICWSSSTTPCDPFGRSSIARPCICRDYDVRLWRVVSKFNEYGIVCHLKLILLYQLFDTSSKARPEAEFFDEIQTKVFRVFFLAIQSHLYSFALKLLFPQTHATSTPEPLTVSTVYIVHFKGERRKIWQKITTPSLWFEKFKQKPQDYAQKPQRNCTFMNSALASWNIIFFVSVRTKFGE